MKTPQTITKSSAWLLLIVPAATQSATALATAAWAGPNICTACLAPWVVTLVIRTVAGLQIRLGVSTASKLEWPRVWPARALANATPTGPSLEPINRSMWATSLPSPTSASPMYMDMVCFLRNAVSVLHNAKDYIRRWMGRRKEKLRPVHETHEKTRNKDKRIRKRHGLRAGRLLL